MIENVVPKQSLMVYMRNMKAKFKDKNRQQHIRVVTEDCGIDNVTLSDNRFEAPHRKPLLQLIKDDSKKEKYAWSLDLFARGATDSETECKNDSQTEEKSKIENVLS